MNTTFNHAGRLEHTEIVKALCNAMASALGMDSFNVDDDFYRLGGGINSSVRVLEKSGLAGLTPEQIYRGRTPEKIAEYYLAELSENEVLTAEPTDMTLPHPLTQAQLGIFLECEKHEGEAIYNQPRLFKLSDGIDMDRLADAVEKTMRAHPGIFSAVVSAPDGSPAMQYQSAYAGQEICTRERMTEEELEKNKASFVKPFDIRHDRLFRIRLIETEASGYLFIDFHHLIFDGSSTLIVTEDIEKALAGETVVPESHTAFDAADAEQAARRGNAWKRAREWYLGRFDNAGIVSMPDGDLREDEICFDEQTIKIGISYTELKDFCRKNGMTASVLTTAA